MAQGFQNERELLGNEWNAVIQKVLSDWRVQKILEKARGQLDFTAVQAFSFRRGSQHGFIVLLPFGDQLIAYVQFGSQIDIMLHPVKPGARFKVMQSFSERNKILKILKRDAFPWLEGQVQKRGYKLIPGHTLLLKDYVHNETLFFAFGKKALTKGFPNQDVSAQAICIMQVTEQAICIMQVTEYELCPELLWIGGGSTSPSTSGSSSNSFSTTTTTVSRIPRLDPGIGGGGGPDLSGYTNLDGMIAHQVQICCPFGIRADVQVNSNHTSIASKTVNTVGVSGKISFRVKSDSCSQTRRNASSASCSTSLRDTVVIGLSCTSFVATGTSRHWLLHNGEYMETVSNGAFVLSFSC